jgi:hypothetical protein
MFNSQSPIPHPTAFPSDENWELGIEHIGPIPNVSFVVPFSGLILLP